MANKVASWIDRALKDIDSSKRVHAAVISCGFSRSRRFWRINLDRIHHILIFLTRYLMRAVTKCMPNFPGNFLCSMSDSARTITKAMSNHFGRLLDPVTDRLSSLLDFVDRMHFA